MTKILVATPTYGPNPSYPEDDVDPETAGGLEPSIQEALNRAEHGKARLDAGVTRVRTVATVALLKAVTGQTTGDHAVVKDLGLFEFDALSSAPPNDVTVVTPTAGGGRWLHGNRGAVVPNGFASLDATGKVPAAQLRGQAIATATTAFTSAGGTASAAPANLGPALTATLAAGQWWDFVGSLELSKTSGAAADLLGLQLFLTDPLLGVTIVPGSYAYGRSSTGGHRVGVVGRYKASLTGTHSARLQIFSTGSGVDYIVSGSIDTYVIGAP